MWWKLVLSIGSLIFWIKTRKVSLRYATFLLPFSTLWHKFIISLPTTSHCSLKKILERPSIPGALWGHQMSEIRALPFSPTVSHTRDQVANGARCSQTSEAPRCWCTSKVLVVHDDPAPEDGPRWCPRIQNKSKMGTVFLGHFHFVYLTKYFNVDPKKV